MKLYKFTAIFMPEEGGYSISIPALPEIATCGDSLEEARYMAQDALELSVLSRLEEGENIPLDIKPIRLRKGSVFRRLRLGIRKVSIGGK